MKIKASEKCYSLIKQSRDFYKVKTKLWNDHFYIGYGHLVVINDKLPESITPKEALVLLKKDIEKIEKKLSLVLKIELNQNQVDAIISLIYDVGIKTFITSELFLELNKGNLQKSSLYFRRWSRYKKQPIYKLIKTRKLEIELFNSPME